MKLYGSNGSCSLGTHILLEEAGLPYELVPVALREGAQLKPEYLAINPKGKVPALALDDGTVLTEWMAIADYVAARAPDARLMPEDPLARARALEVCSHVLMSMHIQGFARIFRPDKFSTSEEGHAATRAMGEGIFREGFVVLDRTLGDREWMVGPYSVADAAAYYVTRWAVGFLKWELSPAMMAHAARMAGRPAVRRAMVAEGFGDKV